MELKVDMPALASQSVDPAAFQRVWDRVMPNQAAPRSDAVPPVTIPDTSVPAEPSPPPEETVPPEQLRALAGELFQMEQASLSAVGRVSPAAEYSQWLTAL